METFRAAGRDGWTLLRWLSVGLWFLALTLVAARFVRPAWVAGVSVATVGLVSWAVVFDRTHPCAIEGSECYQGVATAAAVILSILIVAVALGVAGLARYARRLRSRRGSVGRDVRLVGTARSSSRHRSPTASVTTRRQKSGAPWLPSWNPISHRPG